ncbi:MAG TPA: hypothetical protein VFA57_09360 [Pseudolabrys sp.]|nr:hypothetical protein [Pseudolabrys sp.]
MNAHISLNHHAVPIGLRALCQMAFDGRDLTPTWNALVHRLQAAPNDAAALLDLAAVAQLQGRAQDHDELQQAALKLSRLYRRPPPVFSPNPLRLLAFLAPGDFMANTPIEFMLEDSSIELHMVYVVPGLPLPEAPEHDLAIVAIDESDATQPLLAELAKQLAGWARPVINAPARIAKLTRAGTWELLHSAPGIAMPMNVRVPRATLTAVAEGAVAIESVLGGSGFPIIARPSWSQAGMGLEKLDDAAAARAYLGKQADAEFYLAPFVDYRGADGLYRKARVAIIRGQPYACHMALSEHWMIHYLNANMRHDAGRRAEEARFFAEFDRGFGARHAAAFREIAARTGLDYLPVDCSETADGKLLIFEVGTAMIVHAMDPPDLFPYKRPQMQKVFAAFQALLHEAAKRA